MPIKARSAKAKGTKLEKYVESEFSKIGWRARRQPGSGIYQSFPHDVAVESPSGDEYIVECKSWKHGWRTGEKALGAADILVIKKDFGEPFVYMSLKTFGNMVADKGKPDDDGG